MKCPKCGNETIASVMYDCWYCRTCRRNWDNEYLVNILRLRGPDISSAIIDEISCQCGVDSIGGGMHSSWCAKYK